MSADVLETLLSASAQQEVEMPSGLKVRVKRMRTRELFQFVNAVSTGLGGNLAFLLSAAEADIDSFSSQVISLSLMAMPQAPDETLAWVAAMVDPVDDEEEDFRRYWANPTLEDLTVLLKTILEQEREEFGSLGKELEKVVATLAEEPKPKKSPRKATAKKG